MLIPKWSQTLCRNRESPNGNFQVYLPVSYWNHYIKMVNPHGKTFQFGEFLVNPQMVTNSISERVCNQTLLVWKQAISRNRFQNGFSKWYRNGEPYVLNSISIRGFAANHFHLGIPIWKWEAVSFESPYGKGDSPFLNGDLPFPVSRRWENIVFPAIFFVMCWRYVTQWTAKTSVPMSTWGFPIWNRVGRFKIFHLGFPRSKLKFVTIWGLRYTNLYK